ncbi:MAG: GDP-mannose 4,6-dehydratase, partial [Bacteroidetes bacterium]|nr:GDP-mannose 4,6-dehydratase [Bacteroidota bacterium]
APNVPYAAAKGGGDLMCRSYHRSYNVPVVVTHCSNNYGPYQFPEKLIPLMIINSLKGKKLPVYGDGMNVRDWVYVIDHNAAVETVFENGKSGEVYNVGANTEMPNIKIVKLILSELGKSEDMIEFVKDRLGHDRRYAIDSTKIENELGWSPKFNFEEAMSQTIKWFLTNKAWWERIITGEYQNYYETQYG